MFEIDVFISYSHIDNKSIIRGEEGWVTIFHDALEKRLAMLYGEQVNVWRDDQKISGSDMFEEKIVSQLCNTAILISIITPRYVKSEWCIKEIDEFVRVAENNIGLEINKKSRIFKVIKTYVDEKSHHERIRGTLGYKFYQEWPELKPKQELTLDQDTRKEYKEKLDYLCENIIEVLDLIKDLESKQSLKQKETKNKKENASKEKQELFEKQQKEKAALELEKELRDRQKAEEEAEKQKQELFEKQERVEAALELEKERKARQQAEAEDDRLKQELFEKQQKENVALELEKERKARQQAEAEDERLKQELIEKQRKEKVALELEIELHARQKDKEEAEKQKQELFEKQQKEKADLELEKELKARQKAEEEAEKENQELFEKQRKEKAALKREKKLKARQQAEAAAVKRKAAIELENQRKAQLKAESEKQKAKLLKSWELIENAFNNKETVQGYIKCLTKDGLIVDVFDIEAFLPDEEIDLKPIHDNTTYVDQVMDFMVVKFNFKEKTLVVSHKVLILLEIEKQKADFIRKLKKGQILDGTVKNINSYGVFVDLGGVDGLIHITDLSWGRINHPEEIVELDQKIKVIIRDFDNNKKRIALGLKQLTPHPWDALDQNLKIGDKVKGKVVVIADYGAFVEISVDVEGLIHVSEMSWSQHQRKAQDFLKVGDEVEAVILTLDREERKMSLGMKQLIPDPWQNIKVRYPVGSKHNATVRNFKNFEIIVELEEGVDGLINISDLSWSKKIKHPAEFTKINEVIDVVVLDVDEENRRLSLGHKQLEENPWDVFEKIFAVDTVQKGTIISKSDKGAVVMLRYGVEGFCPMHHLQKNDGSTVRIDETLDFKVIEFSKENRKIILSHNRITQDNPLPDKRKASVCESKQPDFKKPETIIVGKKVGRNDPCPCGSGKKYKSCHELTLEYDKNSQLSEHHLPINPVMGQIANRGASLPILTNQNKEKAATDLENQKMLRLQAEAEKQRIEFLEKEQKEKAALELQNQIKARQQAEAEAAKHKAETLRKAQVWERQKAEEEAARQKSALLAKQKLEEEKAEAERIALVQARQKALADAAKQKAVEEARADAERIAKVKAQQQALADTAQRKGETIEFSSTFGGETDLLEQFIQSGKYEKALQLLIGQEEKIRNRKYDAFEFQSNIGDQAFVLSKMGKHEKSLEKYKIQEEVCARYHLFEANANCLLSQAELFTLYLNKPKQAKILLEEAIKIARENNLNQLEKEAQNMLQELR